MGGHHTLACFPSPPGSRGSLLILRPLSGKEAHVAVSSSPKNHPYSFRRKWLKPPATGRIDSSGVSFDDRLYADVWVSGRSLRKCTLRISEIMQTLENIAIIDDSILASAIRLSKKMSVYFNA